MKKFIFRLQKALMLFWITISSNEVDSKAVRRVISYYFYEEYSTDIITCFTDVRVFDKPDKFIVEITTHRPGILIGKGGNTIDALKGFLNNGQFSKPIEINLKESKMWQKLYDAEFV